jgi:protein tyrosine phosphatase (PTP) superfamily phosphohydrolase (DUF442 family)
MPTVSNVRSPLPGLITAGQPTPAQMDSLIAAGFRNFVSLRPADEPGAGWEEDHLAGGSARFTRLPISGGGDLTQVAVEEFDRILAQTGGEPTVVYCASSNRVGAMIALRAGWLGDVDPGEALTLGRAAGMTRLEPVVTELLISGGSAR